jgi:alkanesulfonate monooxygenase SsuD/methylene tetrahydromethanopterin reductase-like flavin-dependent oxidoreductase (luciferase family)
VNGGRPFPIGLLVGSGLPPERLGEASRAAEGMGFDEVWVSEDFFFSGGIAGAGLALAATRDIRVGLGVVSAVVRHPAQLAMELATLSRACPGRLVVGIGLGVPAWMAQMGLMPPSPLAAIRECVTIVRALLEGAEVTFEGTRFTLRDARLVHPPRERVPIVLGVVGPRLLRLSGSIADGSVLSVLAGDDYLGFARAAIDAGRAEGGRTDPHRVTLITIYSVAHDPSDARRAARESLAFYAAAGGPNALTDAAGISEQLRDLLPGGVDIVRAQMPDDWVERLTVSGTPTQVVERLRGLHRAGADAIVLYPVPTDRTDEILDLTAREVLPRI